MGLLGDLSGDLDWLTALEREGLGETGASKAFRANMQQEREEEERKRMELEANMKKNAAKNKAQARTAPRQQQSSGGGIFDGLTGLLGGIAGAGGGQPGMQFDVHNGDIDQGYMVPEAESLMGQQMQQQPMMQQPMQQQSGGGSGGGGFSGFMNRPIEGFEGGPWQPTNADIITAGLQDLSNAFDPRMPGGNLQEMTKYKRLLKQRRWEEGKANFLERQKLERLAPFLSDEEMALSQAGYGKEVIQSRLKSPGKTSTMQHAEAMGLQPGTPDYIDYIRQQTRKGPLVVNNVGGGPKLPANYMWQDPSNPQAGVTPIPGGPALEPTAEERKTAARMMSMKDASKNLNRYEMMDGGVVNPASMWDQAMQGVPGGAGNFFMTEDGQQYNQAAQSWANNYLYSESGAQVSEDEMNNTLGTYFAQPGDSPKTISAKRQSRAVIEQNFKQRKPNAGAGNIPRVQSIQEAMALPPGTVFIDPNGVQRTR